MLAVLSFSVNAIVPLLLLVLLGYFLHQRGFLTPEFLRVANKFVFKLAIPMQLFTSLYNIAHPEELDPVFLLALGAALLALTLLGCLLAYTCTRRRDRRAVLIQAALRSNYAAAGLAVAQSLAGAEGMALGALAAPLVVIWYNVAGVVSLTIYAGQEGAKIDWGRIAKNTLSNPLILGILAGLAALGVRALIPLGADGLPVFTLRGQLPWLWETITQIGGIGLPLALIVMGGNFHFDAIRDMKKELIAGVLARNLFSPCLGFGAAALTARLAGTSLSPAALAVLTGVFCTPLAVATTVMSAEMGSDAKLSAQITVWSSIGSLLSMFVAIALLRSLGFV